MAAFRECLNLRGGRVTRTAFTVSPLSSTCLGCCSSRILVGFFQGKLVRELLVGLIQSLCFSSFHALIYTYHCIPPGSLLDFLHIWLAPSSDGLPHWVSQTSSLEGCEFPTKLCSGCDYFVFLFTTLVIRCAQRCQMSASVPSISQATSGM